MSRDVIFRTNGLYHGTWSKFIGDPLNPDVDSIPVVEVEKFEYIVVTSHLVMDNGILYEILMLVKLNYRDHETFIVANRTQVLANE